MSAPDDHEQLLILLTEHGGEATPDELRVAVAVFQLLESARDGSGEFNLNNPLVAVLVGLAMQVGVVL